VLSDKRWGEMLGKNWNEEIEALLSEAGEQAAWQNGRMAGWRVGRLAGLYKISFKACLRLKYFRLNLINCKVLLSGIEYIKFMNC